MARRNNAENDITGVLLFNRDYFLQCLEGDAEDVRRTFRTISDDSRHREVTVIAEHEVADRSFPDWSMGLVDSTLQSAANMQVANDNAFSQSVGASLQAFALAGALSARAA